MVERRALRIWGYAGAGAVGAWVITLVPWLVLGNPVPSVVLGNLTAKGFGDPVWIWSMTIAAVLAIVWAFVFAIRSFDAADEFVQQGKRVAWYWGGRLGLAASLPVAMFIGLGGLSWIWPGVPLNRELGEAFLRGYVLLAVMQLGGYLAVRLWWWASKR
jgi:hypothetical protein